MSEKIIHTHFHKIGPGSPPYMIAEAGLNHNGKFDLACRLVDAAADSGAMAVKFQLFRSEFFISENFPADAPGKIKDFFRKFELQESEWRKLAKHTDDRGLDFLCSVFDSISLQFYKELEPALIKIASGDMNNRLLIEDSCLLDLPLLISTGAADAEEIKRTMSWIIPQQQVILLQCVSAYPAKPEDYNLRVLQTWQKEFAAPVGLSDHCQTDVLSMAAIALGACVIEKHFTLNKMLSGPDHKLSLEPVEFSRLVKNSRIVFESLGDGKKQCRPSEKSARNQARKSLYATRKIARGKKIDKKDFIPLRPVNGIEASEIGSIIGRTVHKDIEKGEPLLPDMI